MTDKNSVVAIFDSHDTAEEVERAKDILDQSSANSATVHGAQLASIGA
jgi:hypothetical protein